MDIAIALVALVAAVLAFSGLSARLDVPAPLMLIVVGVAVSFVPFVPEVQLSAATIHAALGTTPAPWPMSRADDGTWSVTIGPVPPNIYVYRFLIDGASVADPANTIGGTANQPVYSTVVVHGSGPAYYDARPVPLPRPDGEDAS